MPIPVDVDYLDSEFTISETEPGTVAEVVELLGEEAVRSGAINDNRYRNKYPRVYKKVSEAIATEHPRKVIKEETKKDGTIKKTLESTNDHIRGFLSSGDEARAKLAELFNTIGNAEPLYVKGERAGGGKVAQAHLDAANTIFAEGEETVEANIAIIEQHVPGYKIGRDGEGAATPESLARGIQALEKHLQNEAKKKGAGLLVKKA